MPSCTSFPTKGNFGTSSNCHITIHKFYNHVLLLVCIDAKRVVIYTVLTEYKACPKSLNFQILFRSHMN
jgi:hypothetical protein